MRSKYVQTAVKNKYGNGNGPPKIFCELDEIVSLQAIKIWMKIPRMCSLSIFLILPVVYA